jgi:hypothetical protein
MKLLAIGAEILLALATTAKYYKIRASGTEPRRVGFISSVEFAS